ncbi:MCC [Branchiostoma lanceolatum]|uniref:MCC protein n=1 Tax=Branchiostoma lanceolatum TaxID=7740 RepID=A0A8K0EKF4_BRALA|nr:MCC [Branchiostoma lanceolatum]
MSGGGGGGQPYRSADQPSTDTRSGSSGSAGSGSTPEEERIKKLFQTCDGDGDGYISRQDLLMVCCQLNMEDSVQEIMEQLGADDRGRISYDEFVHCRTQLLGEINDMLPRLEQQPEAGSSLHATHMQSWPTGSDNSLGSCGPVREAWEYDSGARDLSPEPSNLHKLLEAASSSAANTGGTNYLELANTLHLAALASLKGEILELSTRLQSTASERDTLEKKLAKAQCEHVQLIQQHEDKADAQASRYEERITELHGVIAELRKKLSREQDATIREEEEEENISQVSQEDSSSSVSGRFNFSRTLQDSNTKCDDLSVQLQKVVSTLESTIEGRRLRENSSQSFADVDRQVEELTSASWQMEKNAHDAVKEVETLRLELGTPRKAQSARSSWAVGDGGLEYQLLDARQEADSLRGSLHSKEEELNKIRASLGSIREERDRLRRRVRELQTRLQSVQACASPPAHRPSPSPSPGDSSSTEFPIPKVAERVRLKSSRAVLDRHVLGTELTSMGVENAKVAEHLSQSLQDCSSVQEIFQSVYAAGSPMADSRGMEFEVEIERLNSRIEHLKSQNDLLQLTLEESKANANRFSMLCGKYESNNTALQLALSYSDQMLEAFEVQLALKETELGSVLASCRAAGLGAFGDGDTDPEEATAMLKRAHDNRKAAENVAKQLLQRLDRSCGAVCGVQGCTAQPWEDLSSHSHTSTTSSTASSCDTDFSKEDESRLKDYIQQLKNDRASVRMTIMELESVHIDPDPLTLELINPSAQRLDLENAVLMQELTAMKEEKAELKAQLYLMEKEKKALELKITSRDAQEQAYKVQIDHLKSEVKEHQRVQDNQVGVPIQTATPITTLEELRVHVGGDTEVSQALADVLRREKRLKARIQELVTTLETVQRNNETRHQQSAEFVNDLKRANSGLVAAYEKAKKKHQSRLKKLESQMMAMVDRHETQVRMLTQRIALLEEENSRPQTNETSL